MFQTRSSTHHARALWSVFWLFLVRRYLVCTITQSHSLSPLMPGEMSRCNVLSYSGDPCTGLACSAEGSGSCLVHTAACTGYLREISPLAVTRKLQNDQSQMALGLSDNLLGYLKESGGDKLWSMVTRKFFHFPGLVT